MQQGGKNRRLLEPRRQKLRELLREIGNGEVMRIYGEYARRQVASEKRVTYRLPLVGDEDIMGDGVIGDAEANRDDEEAEAVGSETVIEYTDEKERTAEVEGEAQVEGQAEEEEEEAEMERTAEPEEIEQDNTDERSVHSRMPTGEAVDGDTEMEEEQTDERSVQSQELTAKVVEEDTEMEDADVVQSIEIQPTNGETSLSPSQHTLPPIPAGFLCDKHTTADVNCTTITIENPEAFPVSRIQEVQALYYPVTRILNMEIHRDDTGTVTELTADVADSLVDRLVINDPRIITALGVREPPYIIIQAQVETRMDETYTIQFLPQQRPRNRSSYVRGELIPARHAYLYWLDSRKSADPKGPPTATEARILATKISRRALDVFEEIERYWHMEQGGGGKKFRDDRMKYLGEDPSYPEGGEGRSMSMWV
jgi:hypothetical protein